MSNVLVTGASGRIGQRVVPLLLEKGYRVCAGVHAKPLPEAWQHDVQSLASEEAVLDAVAKVDAVVHLAGIMPPAADDDVFRTNIEFTYRLLQSAAARTEKPRVIFASSDATYCTGWSLSGYGKPIEEDRSEHHPTVFYGASKVMAERLCLFFDEIKHVPTVRLRFVWTLEPAEILDLFTAAPYKEFVMAADAAKWSAGGTIAMPLEEDGTPFAEHVCDARDAAEAVLGALTSDTAPGHAINVAGPSAFRYTEVAPLVAKRLHREAVAARCAGIHSYSLSIEKAKSLLGFTPRYRVEDSLEEALQHA